MGEICLFCTIAICYCICHKVTTWRYWRQGVQFFGCDWVRQHCSTDLMVSAHCGSFGRSSHHICPHLPQTAKTVGLYETAALQYLEGLELIFVASLVPSTRRVTQCIVRDIFWTIRWNLLRAFSVRRDQSSEFKPDILYCQPQLRDMTL